ncbi:galactose-specific lectin nattectin-like [Mytilus galloprovincialis]|uniref:galactose-specific lectin nattectin-like n=1 Tax=Mytilus galloprovincialis TaxID=29158 RepID=UPI003F7B43B1
MNRCLRVIVIIITLHIFETFGSDCPIGWNHFYRSCYMFSNDAYDWLLAESSCRAHDARLVEIESQEQYNYLVNSTLSIGADVDYWIGGRDDVTEGIWKWAFSNRNFSYIAWGPGEPNSYHEHENCLVMADKYHWLWADRRCSESHNFICERKYPESVIESIPLVPSIVG